MGFLLAEPNLERNYTRRTSWVIWAWRYST